MKKAILIFALLINITPAYADQGGWVMVDASGKIMSGTIVCSPDVCGDPDSPYAKATLSPGQRYVQITKAETTGNVAGPNVVAPTPTNLKVSGKVNPVTNVATVSTKTIEPLAPKVNLVKETQTTFAVEQIEPITTDKTPFIEIEDFEFLANDTAFMEWFSLLADLFQKFFGNYTWAWDL